MKPEAQRIAIAEACGANWIDVPPYIGPLEFLKAYHPKRLLVFSDLDLKKTELPIAEVGKSDAIGFDVPDYLNDLNAMHDVVAPLLSDDVFWRRWTNYLKKMDPHNEGWATTASQRAEAFLRAIGKWEESV